VIAPSASVRGVCRVGAGVSIDSPSGLASGNVPRRRWVGNQGLIAALPEFGLRSKSGDAGQGATPGCTDTRNTGECA